MTNIQGLGPQRLATLYRRRWRVEQTIDELGNGHDLDHLVTTRLQPNAVAVGFRLLARNRAIGLQRHRAEALPIVIREPTACCATQVVGLDTFTRQRHTIYIRPLRPARPRRWRLPWARRGVRLVA